MVSAGPADQSPIVRGLTRPVESRARTMLRRGAGDAAGRFALVCWAALGAAPAAAPALPAAPAPPPTANAAGRSAACAAVPTVRANPEGRIPRQVVESTAR